MDTRGTKRAQAATRGGRGRKKTARSATRTTITTEIPNEAVDEDPTPQTSTPPPRRSGSGEREGDEVTLNVTTDERDKFAKPQLRQELRFSVAERSVAEFSRSTNVTDWVKNFRVATAGLDGRLKMDLFRMKIAVHCSDWFHEMNECDDHLDVAEWLHLLTLEYQMTSAQLRAAVEDRRQAEGESPSEYIRDKLNRCKRYLPQMTEEDKLAYIEAGVHAKYRQLYIQYNIHATTVKMAESSLRAAMRYCEELGTSTLRSAPAGQAPPPPRSNYAAPRVYFNDIVKNEPSEEGPPQPVIPPFQVKQEPGLTQYPEASGRGTPDPRSYGKPPPNSEVICYGCRQPGHMRRECPARQRGGNTNRQFRQPMTNRPPIVCYYCQKPGHRRAECRLFQKHQRTQMPPPSPRSETAPPPGNGARGSAE